MTRLIKSKINADVAGNGLSQAVDGSLEVNLGGDVSTSSNDLTVERIQGKDVASSTPGNNQVLMWNGLAWTPSDLPASNMQQWYDGTGDPNVLDPSGSQNGDYYYHTDQETVYRKEGGSWNELGGFTSTKDVNLNGKSISYRTPWLYMGTGKADDIHNDVGKIGDFFYSDSEEKMYLKKQDDGYPNGKWKGL